MTQRPIYLDHNATTPVFDEVLDQLPYWAENFGNASSIHWAGRPAKQVIRESRANLARLIGCDPLEIIFTSGGSESNNSAIQGIFNAIETGYAWSGSFSSKRSELVVSAIEHPSVLKTAAFIERKGFKVHIVPVNHSSGIDMGAFEKVLSEKTALVSMMAANNETGYLLPIKELCQMAHEFGALFHTDAVQALGKIDVDLKSLNVDLASFSAHKFYALKGTGALFVRKGLGLESLIHGGGQERGRRAGTENLLGIASLGLVSERLQRRPLELERLRNFMESRIKNQISGVQFVGDGLPRLGNTSCLFIEGIDGESLLMNLDVQGFAVSTGAACSSGNPEPSPTLLALGLSRNQAQSSLRVSLGLANTEEDVLQFIEALARTVERLRGLKVQHLEMTHV